MTCPNCGRENLEGTNFCTSCGTKLVNDVQPEQTSIVQEPVAEQPPIQPATAVEKTEQPVQEEPAAASAAFDKIEEIMQDDPYSEKKKSNNIFSKLDMGLVKKIGIAAVIVIVAIILISCLRSCLSSSGKLDVAKLPLIYGTDDEVKFLAVGQKEGNVIDDEDEFASSSQMCITLDGKYIFYGTDPDGNEFDLCYRAVSKKSADSNKEVVSGISDYLITPDGNTIVYIKNNDIYKCSKSGKNPVKLAKDFGDDVFYGDALFEITDDFSAIVYENDEEEIFYSTGVDKIHNEIWDDELSYIYFSENEKKIILVESDYDSYDIRETVSICGTGRKDKAETLETNVSDYIEIDENFKSMYYVKKNKLYLKNGTKEGKLVEGLEDDVVSIGSAIDEKGNKHFYAITSVENDDGEENNLYYVEGKKAKLILEDCGTSRYYGTRLISVSNYDNNKDEFVEKHYVRVEYDKFVEIDIPEEDGDKVDYYYTDNNFYTVENYNSNKGTGDLVKYEITKKGIDFGKGVTIAEDVEGVDTTYAKFFDKETILIKHDDEEYSVYSGGKKATEIKADVNDFLWFSKDGTMFLATDSKNYSYTLAKFDGKKVVDIADDVEDAVIFNEKAVYYINDSEELVFNKGKLNRDKVVDEDVDAVLNPARYVVRGNDVKADFTIPTLYFDY